MTDLIEPLIQALKDESAAAAKKNKATGIILLNGRLQSQIDQISIYEFVTTKLSFQPDESQGKIIFKGNEFDCTILATQGFYVHVAIETPAPERLIRKNESPANSVAAPIIINGPETSASQTIGKATFVPTDRTILERLIDRFEQTPAANRNRTFSFAETVFRGKNQRLKAKMEEPIYSYDAHNAPNESQKRAIKNSFQNSLAIIWGPPGTGKTKTIARAVEAHLNAGRRVLLLSHANTAVDTVLEGVASQVENNYYAEGMVVRWGIPKDQKLQKNFPLVLPANQIAIANKHLQQERDIANEKIDRMQIEIKELNQFKTTRELALSLERELHVSEESRKPSSYEKLIEEISKNKERLQRIQAHCESASAPNTQEERDLRVRIKGLELLADERRLSYESATRCIQDELVVAESDLDRHIYKTGINPNDIEEQISNKKKILARLQKELEALAPIPQTEADGVLTNARVVGTTLTKVFTCSRMQDEMFDVAIVDEVSMVPLPHLYWSLSKVTKGVTLVGDFKQLPPIIQSETKQALEWIGRNIFDVLNLATVEQSIKSELVSMLNTQFRMVPEIAAVSSEMFYGGLLQTSKSTSQLGLNDSVFGQNRVVIIDTSEIDPSCTAALTSKINNYSARIAQKLCERLAREHPDITIGITSPYRPQAELIAKNLKDEMLGDRTTVSTVHKFQGSETSVLIFDCTDGPGAGSNYSMLNSHQNDGGVKKSNADVLLNVALTRARSLFILIVNKNHYLKNFENGLLCQFIDKLSKGGITVPSATIDKGYSLGLALNPALIKIDLAPDAAQNSNDKSVYNENDFWVPFWQDLATANRSVFIVSPFLTMNRSQEFFGAFSELIARGVAIILYTRPSEEHSQKMITESENVIQKMLSLGATVITQSKIHQKTIIIDDEICWEGSLNILSQRESSEHMRRLTGRNLCIEARNNLRLAFPGEDVSASVDGTIAEMPIQNLELGNTKPPSAPP